MRRFVFLVFLAFAATACGGGTTATTSVQAADGGLSGIQFEVHENPG